MPPSGCELGTALLVPSSHPYTLLRSRPLFDPGREQVHHFSDALGPHVRPTRCRIDPPQVGLAVELGQGVEERRSFRVGLECRRDIAGQVAALRAFWLEFHDHLIADRDARITHPHRVDGEDPLVAVCREPAAKSPAAARTGYRLDRPAHGMESFGTPALILVKRNGNHRPVAGVNSDVTTELLS